MDTAYAMRFGGIGRLYGVEALARLAGSHVAVIGIGGVGAWAAEGLARSGIGALTLVDLDDVCVTNTNRQLHALAASVGRPKVEVMAERVRAIHPEAVVHPVHDFFVDANADAIVHSGLDLVVDAIDGMASKCRLVLRCREAGVPLVVCGGAGGRRDPTRIRVADLTETEGDGLLRRLRKQLRQRHGLSRKGRWDIPTVYSDEPPVFPTPEGGVCEVRADAASLRLDCASGYGTASFVTGTFGLVAASVAVGVLTGAGR